jgi:hypothetical protein
MACVFACLLIAGGASADPLPASRADAALLRELGELRDAFVRRIDEEGYRVCPRPHLELGAGTAAGGYLPERNLIRITPWSQLSAQQQQALADVPGPAGSPRLARAVYESGTYRWVFVQQLGHWWQDCRHTDGARPYLAQSGANRMALAFWRERDPRFAAAIVEGAVRLVSAVPDPLPPGESAQAWLERRPGEVPQSPTYEWLEAQMIATLAQEAPQPSFHKSLSQPLYPY